MGFQRSRQVSCGGFDQDRRPPRQLHYAQHPGIPTNCFGDTRYFVDRVTIADNEPGATPGAQAPATAPAPSPTPEPAAPPASAAGSN
jgi:hypothetical protein